MPQIPDFSELKGLDDGEWRVWIAGQFVAINDRLDKTNGKVKDIPDMKSCLANHGKQFTALWAVVGAVGLALLIGFVKFIVGL